MYSNRENLSIQYTKLRKLSYKYTLIIANRVQIALHEHRSHMHDTLKKRAIGCNIGLILTFMNEIKIFQFKL